MQSSPLSDKKNRKRNSSLETESENLLLITRTIKSAESIKDTENNISK